MLHFNHLQKNKNVIQITNTFIVFSEVPSIFLKSILFSANCSLNLQIFSHDLYVTIYLAPNEVRSCQSP